MKITTKSILIVGLAMLALTLTLYFVLSGISRDSFTELEQVQVERNVDRVSNAISRDIDNIDALTGDWAWWDDTYAFIEDGNADYLESNMVDGTFEGLNLNLMAFVNSAGDVVYASGFDTDRGMIPISGNLSPYLSEDSPLVNHTDNDSHTAGILLLPEGPMEIASQPILPSDGDGPIRGSLIFGRYLNGAEIASLSQATAVEFNLYPYDNLPASPEIETARDSLSQQAVSVMPLDEDYIAGYTLLEDIYGQPALMARITSPREIYAQGQISAAYLSRAIIIIGAAAILIVLLLLDKQIFTRLAGITKEVSRIGKKGDNASRLTVTGKDELSDLGNAVNRTLDSLEDSQRELIESEEKLRLIFESTKDIIILTDTKGIILEINNRIKDLCGYDKEEFIGKNISALRLILSPDDPDRYYQVMMTGIDIPDYEVEAIGKDGKMLNFEVSTVAVTKDGRTVGYMTISRDISGRKEAETMIQQKEKRYRLLTENISDAIWTNKIDRPEELTYVSPSIKHLLGYSVEEAMSKPMQDVFTPESFERAQKIFTAEMAAEKNQQMNPLESRSISFDLIHADGSIINAEINYSLIRDPEGKPYEILAIARDISERKKMEEKVIRVAKEWRTTFDSITDWISIIDPHSRFTRVNRAFATALGKEPRDLIGKHCYEMMHDMNNPITNCPHQITLMSNKPARTEFFEPKLGVHLEVTTAPIFNEKGDISGTVHITRNITERKHMQEQLMMTDRLASIGELVSGVAHELNNPLTSIIGFSQLLSNGDAPDEIKQDLDLIYKEAQRTADIVNNLLSFARKHAPVRQVSQVHNIIEDVLKLRTYDQKVNNIKIIKRFAENLPEIMVDYFQIQQVFLNIIINAEHFMLQSHNKGTLTITTERTPYNIRVSFADDGPGISPDNLSRVFNPFFTTKDVGKGTGLGLSICHGTVTEHGGMIYVESEPGKGATFIVELPISYS